MARNAMSNKTNKGTPKTNKGTPAKGKAQVAPVKPSKGDKGKGKPSKGKGKPPAEVIEARRFARSLTNGAPLALPKEFGAYGGRGARTALIENAIAGAGIAGISLKEIETKCDVRAAAMHLRTLTAPTLKNARVAFNGKSPVIRAIRPTDGRLVYIDAKYSKRVKNAIK